MKYYLIGFYASMKPSRSWSNSPVPCSALLCSSSLLRLTCIVHSALLNPTPPHSPSLLPLSHTPTSPFAILLFGLLTLYSLSMFSLSLFRAPLIPCYRHHYHHYHQYLHFRCKINSFSIIFTHLSVGCLFHVILSQSFPWSCYTYIPWLHRFLPYSLVFSCRSKDD